MFPANSPAAIQESVAQAQAAGFDVDACNKIIDDAVEEFNMDPSTFSQIVAAIRHAGLLPTRRMCRHLHGVATTLERMIGTPADPAGDRRQGMEDMDEALATLDSVLLTPNPMGVFNSTHPTTGADGQ